MQQSEKSRITKEKILASAEAEFSEKGLAAARVDDIADLAGVNKRMVYAHFTSKEGLYKEVLKIVYARLYQYEDKILKIEFTEPSVIREAIVMYFEFLKNNKSFVRLVLWENLEYAKYVESTDGVLFKGIEKLLLKGKENGFVKEDIDIKQTAMSCNLFCFSAFSNVYTLSHMLGEDLTSEEEMDKRINHVADVLSEFILK